MQEGIEVSAQAHITSTKIEMGLCIILVKLGCTLKMRYGFRAIDSIDVAGQACGI
jgi:hypothetical protein